MFEKLTIRIAILLVFCGIHASGQSTTRQALTWYEKGEREYNKGDYTMALESLNKSLQLNPGLYEAYTTRAAVKERLRDWMGSIIDYSIYLDKFPASRDVLFSRGLARYQAGQFEFARDDFKAILTLPSEGETQTIFYRQSAEGGTDGIMTPGNAKSDYIYNYAGLAEFKLGNYADAITCFDSAIAINPREPDYYVHRGRVKEALSNLEGAEQDYKSALSLNPDHAPANHNLGIVLRKRGVQKDEEEHYTLSIERNPDRYFTHLERAYYRQEHGDLKGALSDYNQAIELKSDDAESWVNRGLVKEKLQNLNGAYQDFSHAIQLQETYEKAWFCRANVLSKMNRLEDARDDYTVAILYHPSYGSAYFNRAVIYHRLGKFPAACDDVKAAEKFGVTDGGKLKAKVCQ